MQLNNKKGFWHCCFIPKIIATVVKGGVSAGGHGMSMVFLGWLIVGILLIPCAWHTRHWESCKQLKLNSPERALCQAEPMWPVK